MNNNEDLILTEAVRSQIHRHYFERAWCELKAKPTLENVEQVKYHAKFMDMSDNNLYTEVDDNGMFYVSFTDENGTRVVSTLEGEPEMTDFEFEDMEWHDVGDSGGSAETINAGNIQEVADKHKVEVFSQNDIGYTTDTKIEVTKEMKQRAAAEFLRLRAESLKQSISLEKMPSVHPSLPEAEIERNIDAHVQD